MRQGQLYSEKKSDIMGLERQYHICSSYKAVCRVSGKTKTEWREELHVVTVVIHNTIPGNKGSRVIASDTDKD